ncbi:MAG TPA: N-acetyltransferase [Micromonosporaceae bacterium]|nr:N-acetyltransferase [Micromonosporaceae bacterium]
MQFATLVDRPELAARINDFPAGVAEFLYHDPVSAAMYDDVVAAYPEFTIVAVDPADPDVPVAKMCTLPFSWAADPARTLPPGGYDHVVLSAAGNRLVGRRGNLVSAVEAMVQPAMRGRGISKMMLAEVCRNTVRLGYDALVAPVRPNRKHEHPDLPMASYLALRRDDGLPVDPWLRVHLAAGARVVGVAPRSMIITGTLAEWRSWTGLPFDLPGPVLVPEALVPVHCDPANDVATYVEPNVWVHHSLQHLERTSP